MLAGSYIGLGEKAEYLFLPGQIGKRAVFRVEHIDDRLLPVKDGRVFRRRV